MPNYVELYYASDFDDNNTPCVIRYDGSMYASVTTLEACISYDGTTALVGWKTVDKIAGTYTFTLAQADVEALNNATSGSSGQMYVLLKSVVDGVTHVEAKTVTYYISEPGTYPDATVSVSPYNPSLPSAFQSLCIQNKTQLDFTATVHTYGGANVDYFKLTFAGQTYTNQYSIRTGVVTDTPNALYSWELQDTRGRNLAGGGYYPVQPYQAPSIVPCTGNTDIIVYRGDSNGQDDTATTVYVEAKKKWSSVASLNTCVLKARWKADGDPGYGSWVTLLGSSSVTDEYADVLSGTFATSTAYHIQLYVEDLLGETSLVEYSIPISAVVFHLGEGGHAVGVGGKADPNKTDAVDIYWETQFHLGFLGSFLGDAASNILTFADNAPIGITPFTISSSTTNKPSSGNYANSMGLVVKKTTASSAYMVFCFDTDNGKIAVNTHAQSWNGWKYLTPTT